jgi:quinoprotein glucose dehydrogenase
MSPAEEPRLPPANGEGQLAIQRFKYPSSLECKLFVAEPDVANIVAFHRDFQGRFFVCETFRQDRNFGVEDNRYHPDWMDDELQARTVQDRINYILKHVPDAAKLYTSKDDRIRLVIDADNDGVADKANVFAKRFNRLEMGTGADVLSYRDRVYYTCIPDLFRLTDTDGDAVADRRESLHTGFGVRFAFRGHDLHGLTVGPDGRLYFSIGDRGYNVSSEVADPASGAVFRCELDGSGLEVFSTGLRNPQNLAFDDLGNLFTADNNSDSGDKARWVFLVPGGDSGWRMYYQYLSDRGPFNREKIWHPFHIDSPPYIVPPVDNIGDGPSGLDWYPGTGFGDEFLGRFFLCDFRGSSANSGIRSFRNEPVGAFWKLTDSEQTIWGVLPTDLQFASDGKLYVSDWVNGWYGENKGRIYSFENPAHANSGVVQEVAFLLRNGLGRQTTEQLVELLGHRDRRVRQEAQFELVMRREVTALLQAADRGGDRLLRVHALWGLAQCLRGKAEMQWAVDFRAVIHNLINDSDPEIRAQAAHFLGEVRSPDQFKLMKLLQDQNLRVRYHAAMALSRVGDEKCLSAIGDLLAANRDQDPIVRHGGIMAIYGVFCRTNLEPFDQSRPESVFDKLAEHESASVRVGLVVGLRKILGSPGLGLATSQIELAKHLLSQFLADADGRVCLEAARAVYDLPIDDLMNRLAQVKTTKADDTPRLAEPNLQDALTSRVIQANYRTGDQASANRLGDLACSNQPVASRIQALDALTRWMTPANNDPLLNDWRPVSLDGRKLVDAQQVVSKRFERLISGDARIRLAAAEAIGKLKIFGFDKALKAWLLSKEWPAELRVAALRSLSLVDQQGFKDLLSKLQHLSLSDHQLFPEELLVEIAERGAPYNEAVSLSILKQLVTNEASQLKVKQAAIRLAGKLSSASSKAWMMSLLHSARQKTMATKLRLDVILATQSHSDPALRAAAESYLRELNISDDPATRYADTLAGGDVESGRLVFENKSEVSCLRCHRVIEADVAVGPNLADIGAKRTRQELLESIVQPNKEISEGYGQIKVLTVDGLLVTGLLKQETETEMVLLDAVGNQIRLLKEDIEATEAGMSSMPLDLVNHLSLTELRDLIEFLAQQKGTQRKDGLQNGNK